MNASPLPVSPCPSCGEELPSQARFCPACGAPADEELLLETEPGPVAHVRVQRRWLGLPASFALLCLGFAALGAAIGLFATGGWAWGAVSLFAATVLFAALVTVESDARWAQRPSQLAAGGRSHAATTAEVWRTRFDTSLVRLRTRPELERLESDRRSAFQSLGEAAWAEDAAAEKEARGRLAELEAERERVESELASHLAGAEERIRRARLPVQDTVMDVPGEAPAKSARD